MRPPPTLFIYPALPFLLIGCLLIRTIAETLKNFTAESHIHDLRHANCRSPFSVDKSVNKYSLAVYDAGFEASNEQTAYFLGIGIGPI